MSEFSSHEVVVHLGTHADVPEHDLRGLPSPLPLQRTLELAEQLMPGQGVCVVTPFYPWPLLDILATRGFDVVVKEHADSGTRVTVRCAPVDAQAFD